MEPKPHEPEHDPERELLGAYALGVLSPEERRQVEAHLTECPACAAELAELRAATTALPLLVEERTPSPLLRDRLLAQVHAESGAIHAPTQTAATPPAARTQSAVPSTSSAAHEQRGAGMSVRQRPFVAAPAPVPLNLERRRRRPRFPRAATLWAAAAVVLLVFSATMVLWNLDLRQQLDDVNQPTQTVAVQFARPAQGAHANLVYLPDEQVMLLNVLDMPQPPSGQVYQIWLINAGGPVPVGVFHAGDSQTAIAANPTAYQTLAVTVEPGPLGSPQPTGAKVITAPLAGKAA